MRTRPEKASRGMKWRTGDTSLVRPIQESRCLLRGHGQRFKETKKKKRILSSENPIPFIRTDRDRVSRTIGFTRVKRIKRKQKNNLLHNVAHSVSLKCSLRKPFFFFF